MPAKIPPFRRLYKGAKKTESGCWEWQGQAGSSGYGQIKAFGKMVSCHRLSFELHNGPIQDGLEVMHSCDNRRCINPDHLSLGTHQQNIDDMIRKGRAVHVKPNPRKAEKNEQSIRVLVLGKAYGSINEAERELGLGNGTVRYWIKTKPNKASVITNEQFEEMKNG